MFGHRGTVSSHTSSYRQGWQAAAVVARRNYRLRTDEMTRSEAEAILAETGTPVADLRVRAMAHTMRAFDGRTYPHR